MKNRYPFCAYICWFFFLALFIEGSVCSFGAEPEFFPVKSPTQKVGLSRFCADWFSEHLKIMREPSLLAATNNHLVQIYRLTVLPTWENPVAVRAEVAGGKVKLYARRLDGKGGYEPGKLKEMKERALTLSDSTRVLDLVKTLNFFQLTVDDGEAGSDGVRWVLEGVSEGKYHVITRWGPDTAHTKERNLLALVEFGRFLIDHSGLSQPPSLAKPER